MSNSITIKGAKENNLKNISLEIPKNEITVFTGVSGSGKSSLVFGTIASESQRLLNETYSSFIQHRLKQYKKPDVDLIANLSVSMVIDQKRIVGNARSTVGTLTDISPMLRLLYSRISKPSVGFASAFSFNNPSGMCKDCQGLGAKSVINIEKLIDKSKSLKEGAINFPAFEVGAWRWTRYVYSGLFDNDKKLKDYSEQEWQDLLYTDNLKLKEGNEHFPKTSLYEGLIPRFERSFLNKDSREIKGKNTIAFETVVQQGVCPTCQGYRLSQGVLQAKVNGLHIGECGDLQLTDLLSFTQAITDLSVLPLVNQLIAFIESLIHIGLGYLNLNREVTTLSGGEAQRIKLVKHLRSSLTGLLYIFDEPSTGLHPSDVANLNQLLIALRDKGNTVLIIEHDEDVIKIADHIVDMGPEAGECGGMICYEGTYTNLLKSDTLTAQYLNLPKIYNQKDIVYTDFITLENLTTNNLKDIGVRFPIGHLSVITGVAGSGKTSLSKCLVHQNLNVVSIDQKPIHTSSRSTIATHLGVMDKIRNVFAKTNNCKPALFSTNSEGACPSCKGKGVCVTDLAFLDAVETECEDCNGTGYTTQALSYTYHGKNIEEVLHFTAKEALTFFNETGITNGLQQILDVGLSHLSIGRTLNTLSGGELQRLKLATQLKQSGNIYLFDEPTTGLHRKDIQHLLTLFNQLLIQQNTVIIVEHNLDVISCADWIVDIGPHAGKDGGYLLYEGNIKGLLKHKSSLTAEYLRKYLIT